MSTEAVDRTRKGVSASDRDERAQAAVKVFRQMQFSLSSYARGITGNPRVRVEMHSGIPVTDGTVIYYRPPIALGDKTPHDRFLCDKRGDNGLHLCAACRVREEVLVNIYHEIAHIAFDTFATTSEGDRLDATRRAVDEWGGKYAEQIKARFRSAPQEKMTSYLGLANLISPFLPHLFNGLEDARVDSAMFTARKGIRKMLEADTLNLLREGVEDAEGNMHSLKESPLNSQIVLGSYLVAVGFKGGIELLHPKVQADIADEKLNAYLSQIAHAKGAAAVYEMSFSILARMRELGYLLLPEEEPEDEPQEEPAESESSDERDKEGGDVPDDSSDDSSEPEAGPDGADGDSSGDAESDREGEGDSGESSPEEADDPSDASEADQGTGQSPSEDGSDAPEGGDDEQDESDLSQGDDAESDDDAPAGDEGESASGEAGGEDAPEDAGPESGDPGDVSREAGGIPDGGADSLDGERSEDGAGVAEDSGVPGDEAGDAEGDEVDGDAEGEGDPSSRGEGQPEPEAHDREDDGVSDEGDSDSRGGGDQEGQSEVGEGHAGGDSEQLGEQLDPSKLDDQPGDGEAGEGQDSDSSDRSELPADDAEAGDQSGTEGAVEGRDGSRPEAESDSELRDGAGDEADESADSDEADGVEVLKSGADKGEGGIDLTQLSLPEKGSPEDVEAALDHGHVDPEQPEPESNDEKLDLRAILTAIIQGQYFETPSLGVGEVQEHQFAPGNHGWDAGRFRSEATLVMNGVICDTDIPEQILGPSLLKTRRIFSDNKTATHERNLKSGRINAKVLGRRAWSGDERLFSKKRLPGKKDYAVLIGMDISSSNLGDNLALLKRSVMAQAELLHRAGVPFSIVAHSCSIDAKAQKFVMHLHHIKPWDKPWDSVSQEALRTLVAVGGNLDGHAMEYMRKSLEPIQATDKILLYYTDGKMPAANKEEELDVLTRQIKLCKRDGVLLLGVGMQTDSPVRHGLDTVQVNDDDDLKSVVDHLGKRLLRGAR